MREFIVKIEVTYSITKTVEAEDWEEALGIADDRYYDGVYDDDLYQEISVGFPVDHDISVHI